MKIPFSQISIVVQGPVVPGVTDLCLISIRKHLPGAHIVLSTWKACKISHLDYDECVLNEDPGCTRSSPLHTGHDKLLNVNRQIVSTRNGLAHVKSQYALKMRTDFIVQKASFVHYFNRWDKRDSHFLLAKKKILACWFELSGVPLFIGDFLFFGLTSDLQELFDIPLQSMEEAYWFPKHEPSNASMYNSWGEPSPLYRFTAEQHIIKSYVERRFPNDVKKIRDFVDINESNTFLTQKVLCNNFIVIGEKEWGISPLKDQLFWFRRHHGSMYKKWLRLYKQTIPKANSVSVSLEILRVGFLRKATRDCFKVLLLPIMIFLPSHRRKELRKKLGLKS